MCSFKVLFKECEHRVNDFIDPEYCKVNYSSFDKVVEIISTLGKSALLAKLDISQAFQLIIINPVDFDVLGIMLEGHYYIDKCLPMGCSVSCAIFEKSSTFLHWLVAARSGITTLDHYLDDFFFAGANSTDDCVEFMETFLDISQELGVPLAEET